MDVKFIQDDPLFYEQELVKQYETLTGRTLYPADPERLILNLQTYALALINNNINYTGRQNLLAYASGQFLDALAELYNIKRLPAQPAKTILRFSIDEPLGFDVVIPAGTRVSAGEIVFKTTEEAKIQTGKTYVDIPAECETAGTIGNGFSIGQISQLLDPLPYVTKVLNVTMSMYGVDEEDDERFRERIRLSIERFSNAGSREAYIYHTKTAHQLIDDVEVYSPSPGVVKVLFLLKGGELPSPEMLQLMQKHLSDEKVRPLTDQVFVSAPEVVSYNINLLYYIHQKDEAKVAYIQQNVEKAVQDFILWTGSKIGRDILPEELVRRIKEAGAYRIVVNSPLYTPISIEQVAKGTIQAIQYGGLVDD
jgi:phage-related baseplate assembly protein